MSRWVFGDGGRAAAGIDGRTADCGVRALAYGLGWTYMEAMTEVLRVADRIGTEKTAASLLAAPRVITGMDPNVMARIMSESGWTRSKQRGRLRDLRLPPRCIIDIVPPEISEPGHYFACVNGFVRDTFNPLLNSDWQIAAMWVPAAHGRARR